MSLLDTASLVVTPNGTKASKLYSVVPSSGAGDLSVTRATTATRVNSSGLIESVASNVPRLDYTNGSCPSVLVEPQRTNLALRSQEFDNAIWTKAGGTMTANATISPDGTNNAEEWAGDGGIGLHDFFQAFTGGLTTSSSIYVKKNTAQFVYISLNWQSSGTDWATGVFDLDNLTTATFQNGTVTSPIASIKDVGNGWRRITLSVSTANTALYCMYGMADSLSPTFSSRGRIPSTSASFYVWGAQLEAGSYATSYIPTTSASVTRNADVISKTGISSLIGQTEGTLFLDFIYNGLDLSGMIPITIGTNTANHAYIYIDANNKVFFDFISGSLISCSISTANNFAVKGTRYKMAFSYKANDFTFYINGNQIGSDSSGAIASLSNLFIYYPYGSGYSGNQNINVSALWKTRLTNTQLATLTTI
jgi:hypothetical protein